MSSFLLKLIAAAAMFIDHVGVIFFPDLTILRVIGRLSFPIYAYFIAEGFLYTKNRLKYFLRVSVLGIACQVVYTAVSGELYLGILISFSISLVIMTLIDCVRKASAGQPSAIRSLIRKAAPRDIDITPEQDQIISVVLCAASFLAAFALCAFIRVDYGFFGILLPVFTSLFEDKQKRLVMFSAVLLALCIDLTESFTVQYWSLLSVPLIAIYNGQRGKCSMKYFFYIFYPAHLALLYAIDLII